VDHCYVAGAGQRRLDAVEERAEPSNRRSTVCQGTWDRTGERLDLGDHAVVPADHVGPVRALPDQCQRTPAEQLRELVLPGLAEQADLDQVYGQLDKAGPGYAGACTLLTYQLS
jgi:hypothetical protein